MQVRVTKAHMIAGLEKYLTINPGELFGKYCAISQAIAPGECSTDSFEIAYKGQLYVRCEKTRDFIMKYDKIIMKCKEGMISKSECINQFPHPFTLELINGNARII